MPPPPPPLVKTHNFALSVIANDKCHSQALVDTYLAEWPTQFVAGLTHPAVLRNLSLDRGFNSGK